MNWNKQNPYLAKITSKKLLSGKQSNKEVFHYEISLGDSGITYQPGDSIGIFPINNSTLVNFRTVSSEFFVFVGNFYPHDNTDTIFKNIFTTT